MARATTTEVSEAPARRATGWAATFSSLRYRDFAILWLTQFGTGAGLWMEMIARSWLVYEMTGSGLLLGTVNVVRAAPQLVFGLLAGVIADRWDRKKLLLISFTANGLLSLAIPVLIWTNTIAVWHILVTSFLTGIAMAFQAPTRQALLPSLIPKSDLMNAMALSNAAMNITRIGGPALAGLLVAWVGIPGAYMAKVVLFVLAIALTFALRLPPVRSAATSGGIWSNLTEGLGYVAHHASLRTIMIVTLIPMLLGMPYMTVMPIFAKEVLGVGPEGFGILQSAPGLGALVASVIMASAGDIRRKGLVMIGGAAFFGVTLVMLGLSTAVPVALLVLLGVGIAQTAYNTSSSTLLMMLSPEEFRGRVMSVYMLDMALNSFGALLVGAVSDLTGVGMALALMGALCAVCAAAAGTFSATVRRL